LLSVHRIAETNTAMKNEKKLAWPNKKVRKQWYVKKELDQEVPGACPPLDAIKRIVPRLVYYAGPRPPYTKPPR
jgi:hypothetical protein